VNGDLEATELFDSSRDDSVYLGFTMNVGGHRVHSCSSFSTDLRGRGLDTFLISAADDNIAPFTG
jgi:hypothetical protein